MTNIDLGYNLKELSQRVSNLETIIEKHMTAPDISAQDWDNSLLMREWNICRRTTANFRKNGLAFYKRGGRIYYTSESREKFIQQQKVKINGGNK